MMMGFLAIVAKKNRSSGNCVSSPFFLRIKYVHGKVAKVLLEFGADSSAKDCNGAFPESVIGAGSPDGVDPACARELSEIVVGHRLRIKGGELPSTRVLCSTFHSSVLGTPLNPRTLTEQSEELFLDLALE